LFEYAAFSNIKGLLAGSKIFSYKSKFMIWFPKGKLMTAFASNGSLTVDNSLIKMIFFGSTTANYVFEASESTVDSIFSLGCFVRIYKKIY